ncbi:DUF975 family protein [Cohnella sp. GCM10012308]|uniref:DUF975 family protein n=1 Tax=Cohnella sp. GCM10012308 TaxID=3317329 RepID=UPI003608190B
MTTSSELRARARTTLQGKWTEPVLLALVYFVILTVIGIIERIPLIGWVASLVLTGPLMLGVYGYFQDLVRERTPSIGGLFSGFNRFSEAFILNLLIGIFVFLWTLLFIVPGIIAAIRYSQAFFILRDNPGIGGLEAINRSKAMMAGNKGRYFGFCLSYLGWAILGSIPFGIGLLWVTPYFYTGLAHFYEDLNQANYVEPPVQPGLNNYQY